MTSTVPASLTRTAEGAALQAVLLDMDGTLVDTEGFWWDVEKEVFADLGHGLEESWRDVVVGGPMTRSAGYLIDVTGADIALDELTVLLNDRFEKRIRHGVPLMPGAERLLAELSASRIPTALVSASHRRIIDRVLDSVGHHHFALTVAGDAGHPYQAAPRALSHRRRGLRRRPVALRGHRGHRDRGGRGRGGGVPGRRRTVRGAHRTRLGAGRRRLPRRGRPRLPAEAHHRHELKDPCAFRQLFVDVNQPQPTYVKRSDG
ncbi:Phosphoglycolate phosphatase [Streptomyces microflavus]